MKNKKIRVEMTIEADMDKIFPKEANFKSMTEMEMYILDSIWSELTFLDTLQVRIVELETEGLTIDFT